MGEVRVLSVPYSKWASVATSFGFTVPLRVALLVVIDVAALVATVGGCASVLKLTISPSDVPAELVATTRK